MLENLLRRFAPTRRAGAGTFTFPKLVFEIQPGYVVGARLDGSARSPRRLHRIGVVELESGSLQALISRPNLSVPEELHQAIRSLAGVVGNGGNRMGLLIPDGVVRVAPLSFETLPDNAKEAEALVRWRMKDILPFPPEEARISYQVIQREQRSVELLAVAVKSSVLSEYESGLEPLDGSPALVLPATLALLPLLPSVDNAGQLLVHTCSGWVTVVVVAGSGVRLWRVRQVSGSEPDELIGEVASEVVRVMAGAGDHLKIDIRRIWVCARPPANPDFCTELAHRISREVRPLVPKEDLASGLPPEERANFERYGASVAGLISNAD